MHGMPLDDLESSLIVLSAYVRRWNSSDKLDDHGLVGVVFNCGLLVNITIVAVGKVVTLEAAEALGSIG